MTKIIHIGDIHIRPNSRHDEYRIVFKELLSKISEIDGDKIVFVGGDIVEEKVLRISPEMIDFLVWFFKSLSDLCPVHIILGNHDGNLTNSDRQDTITPIINAIDRKNIYLYKKSGVYSVNDKINFCVFSCFDEEGWKSVLPEEGKINIALYHGGIFGATTDTGHVFNNNIDIHFFSGYDFVLLADIHKQQFLSHDKKIAYCGSTIQQNFGEDIENHGFLLWNINSSDDFSVDFIKLKNIQPFVSIDWSGDKDLVVSEAQKYPNKSRFRIVSEYPLSEQDRIFINSELSLKKETSGIFFKSEKNRNYELNNNNEKLKHTLRDKNVLIKLVKNFIGEDKFSDDQWDLVVEKIDYYIKSLFDNDFVRNTKCNIKRIEFDNIFGYGEENYINFDSINGLVGLFGPNCHGKSSVIGIIIYSLFGYSDRELGQGKKHLIVNMNRDECRSKVWFNISGIDYLIERKTSKKIRSEKIGIQSFVSFSRVDSNGNILENLGSIDPVTTDKEITKVIGTIEDFLLTTVAVQRNMWRFISEKSTVRKEIVSRFRDLLILDEIDNLAKNDLKSSKAELKAIDLKNWDELIDNLANEKISLTNRIKEIEDELLIHNDSLFQIMSKISELEKKNIIDVNDIRKKTSFVEDMKRKRNECVDLFTNAKSKSDIIKYELSTITREKESIPVEKYRLALDRIKNLKKTLYENETNLNHEKSLLEQKEKTVFKLRLVPCGDQFPTCLYIKDAHEERKNLDLYKHKINELEQNIKNVTENILNLSTDDFELKIKLYESLIDKENKCIIEKSKINLNHFESEIQRFDEVLERTEKELEKMELASDDEITKDLDNLYLLRDNSQKYIKDLDSEKLSCAQRIGQINSDYLNLRNSKKKYNKIYDQYQIYEVLSEAFSKKGIQSQIMRNELPIINKEINKILKGNVGFSIELEIDEESDRLEVYLEDNKGRRPIECCAGLEWAVASMAIRFGLTEASSLPKMNIFMFDEAFNGLDQNHVDYVSRMFEPLKDSFKAIILISHDDRIKNICDMFLDIKNNGGYATIRHD